MMMGNYEDLVKVAAQSLSRSNVKPLFADEVFIGSAIKTRKNEKGELEKEGHFVFNFVDMTTQKLIAKIILEPSTAAGLYEALGKNLKEFNEQMKSKELPEKNIKKPEPTKDYR
jgi:hypothetical protein